MVNRNLETKPSLKSVEKTLDKNQVLTNDLQCEVKGGAGNCSNCEDNRRPPRINGGGGGWGWGWGVN